jgi:energy-coupling factor transporter transmembrane protein EcfT
MRRVLVLAFWLLVSFLSPLSLASKSYQAPAPDLTLASLTPVFAVANAQTAQVLAEATADTLSVKTSYTFAAEAGDGITHLARKAVAEYLTDTDQVKDFSRAEKVYLEDFLQNHVGTFGLKVGQTEVFATSEIEDAVTAVNGVDTNSLEANLAKYVSKVNWQKYESLAFARSTESESQVDQNQDGTSGNTDNSGSTDTSAAQTQNSNTNRTRTVVYIIIVVIILVIAGYLLFRGTEDEEGMKPLSELLRPRKKDINTANAPQSPTQKSVVSEAPKTELKPETKPNTQAANMNGTTAGNGSAPTPMREGEQIHIGEQGKHDYTKSGNSDTNTK